MDERDDDMYRWFAEVELAERYHEEMQSQQDSFQHDKDKYRG